MSRLNRWPHRAKPAVQVTIGSKSMPAFFSVLLEGYQAVQGDFVGRLVCLAASLWLLIWVAEPLLDAVLAIGARFNLPQSILGAVVASAATSAPELGTTLFSLLLSKPAPAGTVSVTVANVGIGSVIGSAVFNLAMIVGAIGVRGKVVPLEKEVVWRDGVVYGASVLLLLVLMLIGGDTLGRQAGIVLLLGYAAYAVWLVIDALRGRVRAPEGGGSPTSMTFPAALLRLLGCIVAIGLACHVLVEGVSGLSHDVAARIGVEQASVSSILSLVVVAAVTSLPDLFTSLAAMRRGDGSLAVGNAVGSNTFDLLVCLGLPYAVLGTHPLAAETLWMTRYLLGTAVVFLMLMLWDARVTVSKGWVLLASYGGFLVLASWLILHSHQ